MIRSLILVFCSIGLSMSTSIPRKLFDLGHVFDNNTMYYPTAKKFELRVVHNGTFNNNENIWSQYEEISSWIHVGSHMDAPREFAPSGWSVDEIPLDRLIVPAAIIDITQQAQENRDYEVTVNDLLHWEQLTGHLLNKVVILMRSGWSEKWHDREAFTGTAGIEEADISNLHSPGLGEAAARWLVDNRNVYGVGSETLSIESGPSTSDEFLVHRILFDKNIYGLENVANLKELPLYGATLYIIPLKIGQASGSPIRIIASVPDIVYKNNNNYCMEN